MRVIDTPDRQGLLFADAAEWRDWLREHHAIEDGLWVVLGKKHVPEPKLVWADAVREALCFGWIDSQSYRLDDDYTIQRFTRRRAGSHWSNINVAAIEQLIAEGRMQPAGLAAFQGRRADRTGLASFESEARELPEEYAALIAADARASTFWSLATPGYRRIATHWVLSAKAAATRDRRVEQLVEDCAAGRMIPSQRYGTEPTWVAKARAALDIAP
jgi:uncharacterized protein YdeI (YjbR/CyaY-like superfamily)